MVRAFPPLNGPLSPLPRTIPSAVNRADSGCPSTTRRASRDIFLCAAFQCLRTFGSGGRRWIQAGSVVGALFDDQSRISSGLILQRFPRLIRTNMSSL